MHMAHRTAVAFGFAISLLSIKPLTDEAYMPAPKNAILYEIRWADPALGEAYKFDVGTGTGSNSYLVLGSKEELDTLDKTYNNGDCVDITETGNYHMGIMVLRPEDVRKC